MRALGQGHTGLVLLLSIFLLSSRCLGDSDPSVEDDVVASEETALVDVCAPLYSAQAILKELQPPVNAHLDRKLGVSLTSRGWGETLGWGHHEGPLSTAFRVLPRLLAHLSKPLTIFSRLPSYISSASPSSRSSRKATRMAKTRKGKIENMLRLLDEAENGGCEAVWGVRGRLNMFPPKDAPQDLPASFQAYKRQLDSTSDAEAQFMVGMFYATGIGGVEEDQGKALLYYTFSALQGHRPAEMALGYRYWAGIGVKEECLTALEFYERAAEKAYTTYLDGPPGGRAQPLTSTRLSDRVGGIYGPQASWASTNANSQRAAVKSTSASARGETEGEILEYYQYHSDRDSHSATVFLGRLFYLGSVYPVRGGVASGGEGVSEVPQSFVKAREYFTKVARMLWPLDDTSTGIAPRKKLSTETENALRDPAMVAASFLGRMAMRGEGMRQDFKKAKMWYERAGELGEKEAHNGLGIMYRDGLGVPVDKQKAFHYFTAAAGQDLAEAQVNLGKMHLDRGEINNAVQLFEVALRHGSPFEAFYLLSRIHATTARLPSQSGGSLGICGVSVGFYKLVAGRGSWNDDYVNEADRAWARGEEDNAMVGWMIGSEIGSEVAQNNVAFLMDQGDGARLWGDQRKDLNEVDKAVQKQELRGRSIRWWIRSAAQDNVDSMVKVGDLYYAGGNLPPHPEYDHLELAANYYQTAADTQTSSMAYWNLGWMYEQGQGVPRDWHLAKRYYDMSGETSREAWPAVLLSLAGLYLRSWWIEFKTRGQTPGLRFFEPDDSTGPRLGLFTRLKNMMASSSWLPAFLDDHDLDDGELYDDVSGSGWTGGAAEEFEWDDDLAETIAILAIAMVIMSLVWLRGVWVRWEEARVRREAEERRMAQR